MKRETASVFKPGTHRASAEFENILKAEEVFQKAYRRANDRKIRDSIVVFGPSRWDPENDA